MWGIKVHQAAINSGDNESGCTVHYVSEEIDGGAIIAQAKVAIAADDTAESLQQKSSLMSINYLSRLSVNC